VTLPDASTSTFTVTRTWPLIVLRDLCGTGGTTRSNTFPGTDAAGALGNGTRAGEGAEGEDVSDFGAVLGAGDAFTLP
jgi:hypothetical protein